MLLTLRRALLPALAAVWLTVVGLGMLRLAAFTYTPGVAASAATRWPGASSLGRDRTRPTLLMFAHPRCPCSRASVAELARLMTVARGRLAVIVVVTRPDGTPPGWDHTDIWEAAEAIPGVTVASDQAAREASLFGAVVSGQSFLYDTGGLLLFDGGLTAGRGHEGDNAGRDAVQSWLDTGSGAARSPVFGCTLQQDVAVAVPGGATL